MSLLDDVSIVVTPNGYKASKLYAVVPVPTEGSELVTNGDFSADASWTKGTGWTISGGSASSDGTQTGNSELKQQDGAAGVSLDLQVGKQYKMVIDITVSTGAITYIEVAGDTNSNDINATGVSTLYFSPTSTNGRITIAANSTFVGNVNSISVKEYTAADMDVTRATAATRVDEDGLIADVLSGVPRIDYAGGGCPHILVEPQRTNIVFPSDVAVTQTRTVTNVKYVLSFYGTGSIVLSGTHSATLTGTGVNDRVDLIFTPTAGSLVLTVSGTVTNFQLEVGSYATSLIPTSGSAVTRNQDIFTRAGIGSLINSTEGVLFVEMAALHDDLTYRLISLSDGTTNNRLYLGYRPTSNRIDYSYIAGGVTQGSGNETIADITDFHKIAVRYKVNDFSMWIDGVEVATDTSGSVMAADTMNRLNLDTGNGTLDFYGKVRQLQVYKTALTDAQLTSLTS